MPKEEFPPRKLRDRTWRCAEWEGLSLALFSFHQKDLAFACSHIVRPNTIFCKKNVLLVFLCSSLKPSTKTVSKILCSWKNLMSLPLCLPGFWTLPPLTCSTLSFNHLYTGFSLPKSSLLPDSTKDFGYGEAAVQAEKVPAP